MSNTNTNIKVEPVEYGNKDSNSIKTIRMDGPYITLRPQGSLLVNDPSSQNRIGNDSTISPATADNLAIDDWGGKYGFHVEPLSGSSFDPKKARYMAYSSKLNKLYIDSDKIVMMQFCLKTEPKTYKNMRIRAILVFSPSSAFLEPVLRCPNHTPSAKSYPFITQAEDRAVMLSAPANTEGVFYEENPKSKRVSVTFPLLKPLVGTNYFSHSFTFTCLGSCIGGINRRPTKIIFTLEDNGEIVGRKGINIRICSCPVRDLKQDETKEERSAVMNRVGIKYHQSKKMRKSELPNILSKKAPVSLETSTIMLERDGSYSLSDSSEDAIEKVNRDNSSFLVPVSGFENFKALNKFAEFLEFQNGILNPAERSEMLRKLNGSSTD